MSKNKPGQISLSVHPYLEAYFTKGLMSKQMRWFFKYKKWVPVRGLSSYKLLEYSFRNKKNKKNQSLVLWTKWIFKK